MARAASNRIVWREQGGERRAYFEGHDLGLPNRVALKAPGCRHATTDPDVAADLAVSLEKELRGQRKQRERLGTTADADLRAFAAVHMQAREASGRDSDSRLDYSTVLLDRAIYFFDLYQAATAKASEARRRCAAPRNLMMISVPDVHAFASWLASPAVVPYELEREAAARRRADAQVCRAAPQHRS